MDLKVKHINDNQYLEVERPSLAPLLLTEVDGTLAIVIRFTLDAF